MLVVFWFDWFVTRIVRVGENVGAVFSADVWFTDFTIATAVNTACIVEAVGKKT